MDAIISWTQNIAVCLVIVMLLELILPKGNIKKYVKIIIGLYIMFNIISPIFENVKGLQVNNNMFYDNYGENKILEKMNIKIDNQINKIQSNYQEYSNEIEQTNENNIRHIYKENVEEDIKNKINNYEYETKEINITIADDETYQIEKIEAKVRYKEADKKSENKNQKQTINKIDTVKIDVTNKEEKVENIRELTDQEKDVLSTYLAKDYNISKKNIVIY